MKLNHFSRIKWTQLSLSIVMATIATFVQGQETGRISGTLIDSDTGELLIAAQVSLEGSEYNTTSDLSGNYRFRDIPEGTYVIFAEKYGYHPTRVTEIQVVAGELTNLDLPMRATADNIIELEAFVVKASDVQDLGIELLADRKEASSISDAIGSDDFSKFGAGDAADAMTRVTGVSVNDGKYVFVRGLGERYSNTLMNGVTLPSADPDKKAVQMDLFPTDLLESIVTTKSFTPDKPGDFAGGSVNIKTRSFPDLYTLSISSSIGFNPNANLNGDFLSYPGGNTDIFGFDDGTRDLPEGVPTDPADFPSINFLPGAPEFFDEITHKFSPIITPSKDKSFLNTGFSIDFGNSFYINDDQLIGIVASLTYDLSFDHYENGVNARYRRDSTEVERLGRRFELNDTKSTMSASLGGLLSLAYQPSTNHEFALIVSSTQSADDEARFQQGPVSDSGGTGGDSEDQIRSLVFTERNLTSAQFKGEHFFESNEIKVNWSATSAISTQKDPDARYMNNELDIVSGVTSLTKPDRAPRRVFRDLSENQNSGTIDVEIPIFEKGSLKRLFKAGGVINKKTRDFEEQVYQYEVENVGNSNFSEFTTAEEFLDPEFLGVSENPPTMKRFINFARGQIYEGDEEITAIYGMLDFEVSEKWRLIGGVRQENTDLNILSLSKVDERFFDPEAEIVEDKTLPAIQAVYKINDTQSVRASWSQTLARPTFREIAPYRSFPFIGGDEYLGNQDLTLTDITNWDLRWEWYPNPGEVISVGVFAKELELPIEIIVEEVSGNYRQQPVNVGEGEIQGIEIEVRKNLYFISEALQNFSINANLTISQSEVDNSNREFVSKVPFFEDPELVKGEWKELVEELQDEFGPNPDPQDYPREKLLELAPNTPTRRDIFGQPDIIANVSLSYDNPLSATSVSLNFNYVGKKLAFASQGATPDVYDAAREKLDLIIKQGFGDYWSIKFSAKNLTDSSKERFYDSVEQDIFSSYKSGRSFSLSATYKFQ